MVEMDGTAKSQVKVMNLDDGSSFFLPLFIYMVQFLLILLIIRFPPWQQIFKYHHIVFNMDMESKECPVTADAYAINKIIANQFLAISYFINTSSFYNFLYGISNGIKHFSG